MRLYYKNYFKVSLQFKYKTKSQIIKNSQKKFICLKKNYMVIIDNIKSCKLIIYMVIIK